MNRSNLYYQPLVQVITRAKKNYVAYFPAPPKPPGKRGRQRQYGMKMVLWEAFDYATFCREVTLCIYGKEECADPADGFIFGVGRGNPPHPVLPPHPV